MNGEIINNMDFSLFHHIKAMIFDVDGVFTNSEVLVTENGDLLRTMSTRDGQAVRYALDAGYIVAIITKGASAGVRSRFEYLGLTDIYDKLKTKEAAFEDLQQKYNLTKEDMLYMGDDIPDLVLFDRVSIPACPQDAAPEVIARAQYISPYHGGKGCVRDVIEKVMRIQGKWVI